MVVMQMELQTRSFKAFPSSKSIAGDEEILHDRTNTKQPFLMTQSKHGIILQSMPNTKITSENPV